TRRSALGSGSERMAVFSPQRYRVRTPLPQAGRSGEPRLRTVALWRGSFRFHSLEYLDARTVAHLDEALIEKDSWRDLSRRGEHPPNVAREVRISGRLVFVETVAEQPTT